MVFGSLGVRLNGLKKNYHQNMFHNLKHGFIEKASTPGTILYASISQQKKKKARFPSR